MSAGGACAPPNGIYINRTMRTALAHDLYFAMLTQKPPKMGNDRLFEYGILIITKTVSINFIQTAPLGNFLHSFLSHTLSPTIIEVENGSLWTVTTSGGTHFWIPYLWEEGYLRSRTWTWSFPPGWSHYRQFLLFPGSSHFHFLLTQCNATGWAPWWEYLESFELKPLPDCRQVVRSLT